MWFLKINVIFLMYVFLCGMSLYLFNCWSVFFFILCILWNCVVVNVRNVMVEKFFFKIDGIVIVFKVVVINFIVIWIIFLCSFVGYCCVFVWSISIFVIVFVIMLYKMVGVYLVMYYFCFFFMCFFFKLFYVYWCFCNLK